MDFLRINPPTPVMHQGLRTAVEALRLALLLTLSTTLAVNWILQIYGYSSALADTLFEAQQWFLPMFAYLWGMFWMIDISQRRALSTAR